MIPDEAVEAAAAGMWEQRPMQRTTDGAPLPFREAKDYQRTRYLQQARAALEAAAPHMLAESEKQRKYAALDAISELGSDDPNTIPYRSQA